MGDFLRVIEKCHEGVVIHHDGEILYANPAMAAALKAGDPLDLIGSSLQEWLHPETQEKHAELMRGAGRPDAQTIECQFQRTDGEPALIELTFFGEITYGGEVATLMFCEDITERRRLEREVLEISARERQQLAFELHDGLGQHLAATAFRAKMLQTDLAEKSLPESSGAAEITLMLNEAIALVRHVSHGLDPVVENRALDPSLERFAMEIERLFHVKCHYRSSSGASARPGPVASNLYRIAQEAVRNAIHHGRATDIQIELAQAGGNLLLTVRDNGTGMQSRQKDSPGMGLRIMQHRARALGGSLHIEGDSDAGMLIRCVVPMQDATG